MENYEIVLLSCAGFMVAFCFVLFYNFKKHATIRRAKTMIEIGDVFADIMVSIEASENFVALHHAEKYYIGFKHRYSYLRRKHFGILMDSIQGDIERALKNKKELIKDAKNK